MILKASITLIWILILFEPSNSVDLNKLNNFGKSFNHKKPQLDSNSEYDDVRLLLKPLETSFAHRILQKVDHFVPTLNSDDWLQRYWKNDEYSKPNGPNFLLLGGESASSVIDIVSEDLPLVEWAQVVGATIWMLEHRFYGESRPFENQTDENLKYLTTEQALADAAYFIKTRNLVLNLYSPKWIVFGGSYTGALALWFRQKYPELVIGAVGSSPTVYVVLDYYGYYHNCEEAIRSYDSECANSIKMALNEMAQFLETSKGRSNLNILFGSLLNETKITDFEAGEFYYFWILGPIANVVQYNNPSDNSNGIAKLCQIMNIPSKNKVFNLAIAQKALVKSGPSRDLKSVEAKSNFMRNMIHLYKNPGYENPLHATDRAWLWQVCNHQVAFVTVSDKSSILGQNYLYSNYHVNLCKELFGEKYTFDHFVNVTAKVTQEYGGTENYKGTNVVATWGTFDPWKDLCLTESNHPSVVTYEIEGASHCSDLGASTDGDSESLKNARKIILENIQKWIQEAEQNHFAHPKYLKQTLFKA